MTQQKTDLRAEQEKEIREACIAANPEKTWRMHEHTELGIDGIQAPIQLADVLVAIGQTKDDHVFNLDMYGEFVELDQNGRDYHPQGVTWNLRTDLSGQSDETINFLYQLLHKV